MMDNEPVHTSEDVLMEQEENCRKALKNLTRALFMRVFILAILLFALLGAKMQLWFFGLMVFVLVITLTGSLPLITEWKKQRRNLHEIMEQYE